MKKENSLQTEFIDDGIVIITENVDGKLYVLKAKCFEDILEDWKGDCQFVPANDDRVFFASCNGELVKPYVHMDFESLLTYLNDICN